MGGKNYEALEQSPDAGAYRSRLVNERADVIEVDGSTRGGKLTCPDECTVACCGLYVRKSGHWSGMLT